MIITSWKQLFEPHILSRGLEYYEAELVTFHRLEETMIEATVEGTYPYGVEIALRDGRVEEMDCDCPYAADGNYCKHMAAVLFAADDAAASAGQLLDAFLASEQIRHKTAEHALQKAVSAMSEDELRALVLDAARKHSDIRRRIEMRGKTSAGPTIQKRWKTDLAEITRRASDRHGFIDYYHASDYTTELSRYLGEEIEPLLENRLIMDAFSLVGLVYAEALNQEMDDSDGGLSYLINRCLTFFQTLLSAPEAEKEKILPWFTEQLRHFSGGLGEDCLWPVVLEGFTDERQLSAILDLLDDRINNAGEHELSNLIEYRIALMERMGKPAKEIEAYRKRHWALPFIRKKELDRLESQRHWTKALALLRECEEMDSKHPDLLREYNVRRIGILRKAGPEKAYREALEAYVFGFPQWDMSYVNELKKSTPAGAWPELLDRLFHSKNTKNLRRMLQLSEGMLDQMMEELEAGTFLSELQRYEKDLRKVYPERVRDLMLTLLDSEMQSASSRSDYARIVHSLKRLYGYPNGREKAAALAKTWREKLSRRRAMLDELDKAKL